MAIEALHSTFSGKKWKKIGIKKRSGILVPLFSIHSSKSIGIGDFSDLRLLVDLCVKTKNSILQILPVNFSGHNNCPYSAISSFAMDPVYISLSDFYYRGHRFSAGTIRSLQKGYPAGKDYRCNYAVRDVKLNFLREVFEKIIEDISSDTNFSDFMKASDYWLEDFSIYCVLKTINGGVSWYEWEDRFKNRDKVNIAEIKVAFGREILFNKWIQYICYHQLCEAREYAFKKGVYLMGDLPVLPSMDSADVWSKRELFNPDLIAGAPPDMYCVYGQRWGMPVLDRKNLKSDGYRYIVEKLRYLDRFFDMIRIDHVVGLFRIWAIPADQPEETQGLNGFFIPEDQS